MRLIRAQYKYVWNKILKPLRISDMDLATLLMPDNASPKAIKNLYTSINQWANGKSQLSSNQIHSIIQFAAKKDIVLEFEKMYESPGYTHHRYQYEKENAISIEQDVKQLTH